MNDDMSQPYNSGPDTSAPKPEKRGKYTLIEVTELAILRAKAAAYDQCNAKIDCLSRGEELIK